MSTVNMLACSGRPVLACASLYMHIHIFKVWCHINNPTQSIDAYLIDEQSCQISSWADLKWRSPRLSWRAFANKNNNTMISNMGTVPDPKCCRIKTYDKCYSYLWMSMVSAFFGLPLAGKCMITGAELIFNCKITQVQIIHTVLNC